MAISFQRVKENSLTVRLFLTLLAVLAAMPHARPVLKFTVTRHQTHDAPDGKPANSPHLISPHARSFSPQHTCKSDKCVRHEGSVARLSVRPPGKHLPSRWRDANKRQVDCNQHLQSFTHSAARPRLDVHIECLARYSDLHAKCPLVLSDLHNS
jgi:hypothetical protein